MKIAFAVDCLLSEGPGRRFGLWTRGCDRHCDGCVNERWWGSSGKREVSSSSLICEIQKAKDTYNIEGITVAGGEPFLQKEELFAVLAACKSLGLSVILFTGHLLEDVKNEPLLNVVDVLVDGPYVKDSPETLRNWVGSSNQKFHFITDRYSSGFEYPTAARVTPQTFWLVGHVLWARPTAYRKYRVVL